MQKMPTSVHLHRITATTTSTSALNCHKQSSLSTWKAAPPCFALPDDALQYHAHVAGPNQCCSVVVQHVAAPVAAVWSVLCPFDNPQAYKHFLKSCHVVSGDGRSVGTVREVSVVSGLPAATSTERLDVLDEEHHVIGFSIVGGEHRLQNYRSVTTLHHCCTGGTLVVESYIVDVPPGNTKEETCSFVDTIVRCNLQSLAQISEKLAKNNCESC